MADLNQKCTNISLDDIYIMRFYFASVIPKWTAQRFEWIGRNWLMWCSKRLSVFTRACDRTFGQIRTSDSKSNFSDLTYNPGSQEKTVFCIKLCGNGLLKDCDIALPVFHNLVTVAWGHTFVIIKILTLLHYILAIQYPDDTTAHMK